MSDCQHLRCPITLELFIDPVLAEDGQTYERSAIIQWIQQHGTSPFTRQQLSVSRLTPNRAIKTAVENFKRQNGESRRPSAPRGSIRNTIVLCETARWFPNGIVVAGGNGGGGAMNQLYKPESIAFDRQQNLYVSDPSFSRIQKYSRNSEEIVTLVTSVKAGELFIDRYDNLYFTVSSSHTVQKRSAVGGSVEVVAGNGRYGAALNQLNVPKAVYVDREESVYVVDMNNQRIVKWLKKSTTGIMLFGGTGVLKNPVGLFVDEVNELGAVYVCTHNSKVVKWMPNTQQLITVAGSDKAGNGSKTLFVKRFFWDLNLYCEIKKQLFFSLSVVSKI
ncbi:unnamed protein product [Adineta steineri]|uniref:U-box domain-containing protein n=1 Tax=Adineta steineri TaxID=433720 RepID=A0A815K1U0_9BILA|nr:unnamed protein product [Adineta steineri]CAF1389759.1 unnamed protein product [Adineta steineri]